MRTAPERPPRFLLLLGQSPFDPTSGAAQSTRIVAEIAAACGFTVDALATTACEGPLPRDHDEVLAHLGLETRETDETGIIRFERQGVHYRLLPVPQAQRHSWEHVVGQRYDAEYSRLLQQRSPDIVLTFGGDPADERRRAHARRRGAKVVFALHNLYYRRHVPREVDAFLAPTHFLCDAYRASLDLPIAVLPPAIDRSRSVAGLNEPAAVVFVNPEPAKGAVLVAQLAERLGRERPDATMLIVGGRVPAHALVQIGADLGLDLARHANLLQVDAVGRVSELWAATRILLMPSIVPEAAGRCTLEAMANGAVPLVSNRAGLAEIVGAAGFKLPPPPDLDGRAAAVPEAIVDSWWQTLVRLIDNESEWRRQSTLCRAHADTYSLEALAPAYGDWFRSLLARPQAAGLCSGA